MKYLSILDKSVVLYNAIYYLIRNNCCKPLNLIIFNMTVIIVRALFDITFIFYSWSGTHWTFFMLRLLLASDDLSIGVPSSMELFIPEYFDKLPTPRLIHSHFKPNLLPKEALSANRKIILIVRNPKDTVVSLYHHLKRHGPKLSISWSCFLDNWMYGPCK